MIYCPQCKRPSARKDGTCPHCGAVLGAERASAEPQKRAPEAVQADRFGGADLDLGDAGDSGLELDEAAVSVPAGPVAPAAPVAPPSEAVGGDQGGLGAAAGGALPIRDQGLGAMDPAQVAKTAQFGVPQPGAVGAVRYALRVWRRLPELRKMHEEARIEQDAAWKRLDAAKAALGHAAVAAGAVDASLAQLVKKAQQSDAGLEAVKEEAARVEKAQREKIAALRRELDALDAQAAPVRDEEVQAQARVDKLHRDRQRAQARVKRSEIELRNFKNLIEARQQAYADTSKPEEERRRLLDEIAQIDHKQGPVRQRLAQEREALEALEAPCREAEAALEEVRGRLAKFNAQLAALRERIGQEERTLQQAQDDMHNRLANQSEQALAAWAQVGERVYVARTFADDPSLTAVVAQVQQAADAFFAAQERTELLRAAQNAYDADAVSNAQKIVVGIAVGVVALVVIVAVSL